MIHLFVLLQPFGKKKLNKDGGDKGEKTAIVFPHQEESNYSRLTALQVYDSYPELLQTFSREVWCAYKDFFCLN